LLGHAWELACASGVTIEINSARVPLIKGALELAAAGLLTSGDKTNREYVGAEVEIAATVDPNLVKLFYDPQTAGGLLLSISEEKAEDLLAELREHYPRAEIVGRVVEGSANVIVVK
jgi:selenide,water dikinase